MEAGHAEKESGSVLDSYNEQLTCCFCML